jgi:hypothetical protein
MFDRTRQIRRAIVVTVARRRQKAVLELAGKLEWDAGYDYKKERTRRCGR